MIDTKLLTLIAVAELGSFSKAAKELNLTQPAVSTHIRQLEREMGTKLINRGENGIKLTNEGNIALRYAKRIQSLYNRLDLRLKDAKKNLLTLSVGITHTAESSNIVETLARYANEAPDLHINFITSSIKNLYELLEEYAIDVAIVEGPNLNPQLNAVLLDTDSLLCAVSPDNPLAQKKMVTLEELTKEKMVLRSVNSGTRQLFESSIQSQGLTINDFDINIESDSLYTIKDLVMNNIGVSIVGRSSCVEEEKKHQIVLLPIVGLPMIRQVNLVYPKDFNHPEVLSGFIALYNKERLAAFPHEIH